jgi:iron complex transport system ATP-binding protein
MGLEGFAERQVPTLSGGERQRLAIAALLVQQPRLYLLDEPLSHLDLHHEIAVLEHFRGLAASGSGVAMVLHDINLAARYASHVLLLDGEGGHVFGPARKVLTVERLSAAFGHPLRAVIDGDSTLFVPV